MNLYLCCIVKIILKEKHFYYLQFEKLLTVNSFIEFDFTLPKFFFTLAKDYTRKKKNTRLELINKTQQK